MNSVKADFTECGKNYFSLISRLINKESILTLFHS